MALQCDISLPEIGNNFSAPQAYINLDGACLTKSDGGWIASAVVCVWYDSQARSDMDAKPLHTHTVSGAYTFGGQDVLAWLYGELKKTDLYSGAIDV